MKPFTNKGEAQLIAMGVGLVTLIILGYIAYPVISGVNSAINLGADNGNNTMLAAKNNYTNSVAGALTLFGVSPIVYAAAIVLVILVVYLVRK